MAREDDALDQKPVGIDRKQTSVRDEDTGIVDVPRLYSLQQQNKNKGAERRRARRP